MRSFLVPVLVLFLSSILQASEPVAPRPASSPEQLKTCLENMVWYHRYTLGEIQAATGLAPTKILAAQKQWDIYPETKPSTKSETLLVLPYPGGRHPRIGFLEGAIDPQRETKVSVFLPWKPEDYVVCDIPEAIWSNLGLTYLAHTHVETIWEKEGFEMEPREWEKQQNGAYVMSRTLPNGIQFGTKVLPRQDHVALSMWLTNGTESPLTDLRVQNCVMLREATEFNQLTNDNKFIRKPYMCVRNTEGTRWVISAWVPNHRPWGNDRCPCLHSDPKFPDCQPGETQRLRGWLSFYQGTDIATELGRIDATGWRLKD